MYNGNVVDPGPDTKKLITKSSIDNVNVNNAAEMTPGAIAGNVTKRNVCHGVALNHSQPLLNHVPYQKDVLLK